MHAIHYVGANSAGCDGNHCPNAGFPQLLKLQMLDFAGSAIKTFLTCIALAVGIVFTSQAFAASGISDCAHVGWKNGHYICDLGDDQ